MLNCLFLTASTFLTFVNNIVNFAAITILEFSFSACINTLVMFTVNFLLSAGLSRCEACDKISVRGPNCACYLTLTKVIFMLVWQYELIFLKLCTTSLLFRPVHDL